MVNMGIKRRKAGTLEAGGLSWRWVASPVLVGVLSLLWLHVFAPPPPTTEMQLRAFEAWIRQHGGRIGNVQLAAFPGMGIGVQTTSDITEKDEVLYLPRDLVICRDTVTKQLPREFLRTGPHADDDLLATFLLLERLKGPASKWAPYLAVLPSVIPSPMSFTKHQVAALHDEALIQLIGDAKRSTTAAFKALLRKLSAVLKKRKASLSLDDYIWATSVLGSRALTIQGVRYLVPFADMFNGQSHPSARLANNGARFLEFHQLSNHGDVRILADRPCAKFDQLVEDYGDNDNYIYFMHHGFTMSQNPFDCVRLPLPSPSSSKANVLASYGVPSSKHICVQPTGDTLDIVGWAILQALVLTDGDAQTCATTHTCLEFESPGKVMTHADAAAWVLAATTAALQAFATTADEDEHVLSTNATTMSPNMQLVITFRRQRKLILQQLVVTLTAATASSRPASEANVVADAAAVSPEPANSVDDKIRRFHQWFNSLTTTNKLHVRYMGPAMGYGTFATEDIAADDVYVGVPTASILDSTSATRHPHLATVFRTLSQTSGHRDRMHELVLHLIHERFVRQEESPFAPYLALLPPLLEDGAVPLMYSAKQLAALKSVDLHEAVVAYQLQVEKSYQAIHRVVLSRFPEIFPASVFTWERYRWARYILDTRSIWWQGERHLVPMLDMVNCQEGPANQPPARVHRTALSADGRVAVTRAAWAFPSNSQVVENYGQPNWIYFLYHGFVLSKNSHDCAHIVLDMESPMQKIQASDLYEVW
ncbi:hypothetical protein, variant 2 [Aphanomyces astaci]|uniref:SET domain-containing protein n=1 Tax=Aphanomyces astaci TaxID=112090 RepID=W4FR80_APHAT|nr:hypothetical protein, variant 2 [Aphanomyces astaci]ETV69324.1 hypothetical protein, variant 2 [Aphanomyces astaci]|eukprot:XP_009841181.1 hypothetical protein, variant 2 [Aphanomyces astaci]